MENEKEYIITIDDTDCSGKSTLWKKANEYNKNIQIRGILSNIAYGIKYGRNIEESILAQLGKKISWIFQPTIGTNSWEATVSI